MGNSSVPTGSNGTVNSATVLECQNINFMGIMTTAHDMCITVVCWLGGCRYIYIKCTAHPANFQNLRITLLCLSKNKNSNLAQVSHKKHKGPPPSTTTPLPSRWSHNFN